VGVLSRYMQSLHQFHWTVACRVLRHLKRALAKKLYYRPSSHLDIVRYSYTEWVGDPIDRHSITRCTFVGDNLVVW